MQQDTINTSTILLHRRGKNPGMPVATVTTTTPRYQPLAVGNLIFVVLTLRAYRNPNRPLPEFSSA